MENMDLENLKSHVEGYQRRAFEFELRATDDGEGKLVGHAAVFNKEAELFGFREKIQKGAFKKTIKESDVRALWNHNSDFVLGRNKADTLELREDEKGLLVEIEPPDTQWARDLGVSIERGDVSQMSFGFETVRDQWTEGKGNQDPLRELLEVRLFDVSPVTFPAYPQTDIQIRSLIDTTRIKCGLDVRTLTDVLCSAEPGKLADPELAEVRRWIEALEKYLPEPTVSREVLAVRQAVLRNRALL